MRVKELEPATDTYRLIEAEKEEGFEIVISHTVANPRAVVVHLWDANITYTAVMCSLRLPVSASLTVHLLVGWRRLGDDLGSFEGGQAVGEKRHEHKEVEENFDEFAVDLVSHPLVHLVVH